jgi:hypothetical protein
MANPSKLVGPDFRPPHRIQMEDEMNEEWQGGGTDKQWRCPTCAHLMTEEESKGYRGCPTGMHPVQHEPAWQGGGTDRRRNPERVKELEAQLAAEREALKIWHNQFGTLAECVTQLAAEREAGVKVYLQLTLLEKKLAAEREKREAAEGAVFAARMLDERQVAEALTAEREATKKAYAEGWRVGRDFAVEGQRDTAANPPQAERPDRSERDWSEHLRIQLAAEVEKVNKLQEQLAAERESHEKELDVVEANWSAELAAERADRISWQELYEKTNEQLQAQLIGYRGTAASGGTPP